MTLIHPIAVKRIEAAELISVSVDTWDKLVESGEMPKPVLVKNMNRWIVEDILAALREQTDQKAQDDWRVVA